MKKAFWITGVILLFLVVTSPQSYAETVINGCVNTNGKLRIVSDSSECKESETAISWNKDGPQGPPGMGGLGVYYGEGFFLGYLLQRGPSYYTVLDPDVLGFFRVHLGDYPHTSAYVFPEEKRWFTSMNCDGQAYISLNFRQGEIQNIMRDDDNNPFMVDFAQSPVPGSEMLYSLSDHETRCVPDAFIHPVLAFPIKPVDFIFAPAPLQQPIVVRPIE